MTRRNEKLVRPTRGTRAVDAESRARLSALLREVGMLGLTRSSRCGREAIGKAIDGMPLKESTAQRLEDYVAEQRVSASVWP